MNSKASDESSSLESYLDEPADKSPLPKTPRTHHQPEGSVMIGDERHDRQINTDVPAASEI